MAAKKAKKSSAPAEKAAAESTALKAAEPKALKVPEPKALKVPEPTALTAVEPKAAKLTHRPARIGADIATALIPFDSARYNALALWSS